MSYILNGISIYLSFSLVWVGWRLVCRYLGSKMATASGERSMERTGPS
jgi:hypothetical protein